MSENEKKDEKKFEVKVDENKGKFGKIKIVIGILVLLLVVIAGIVGVKFYLNSNAKTGRIEFVIVDQTEIPVVGAEINLAKENGEDIGTVKSGADGKINYYNVKEGNYVINVINMPEGYEIDENAKDVNIEVQENTTTEIEIKGKRNIGALKVIVKDENDNLMEGVEVNFCNVKGELIEKLVTDENGVDYKVIPEEGVYYFDLATSQEITGSYLIDTTLYRINIDETNKTFIKELKVKKDLIENVIAEEAKDLVTENVVAAN